MQFSKQLCAKCALTVFLLLVYLDYQTEASRYKSCDEGCCEHEYCAYDRICYPKSKCRWGCPDGECVDGNCQPHEPCESSYECQIGHTCTPNYNLGYDSCQYDLEIGNSLCVRRKRDSPNLARILNVRYVKH